MTSSPDHPPRLISEDDRDMAVRRLQEAYAEGLISHEEMDERLHQALTAKVHTELVPALASLPEIPEAPEVPETPEEKEVAASTISVASGRILRRGAWRVPRFLKVESSFARVHLDLSRAVIEHEVVDIELQLGSGRARITVPRDAIVDIDDLRTTWKDARYAPRRPAGPGGPRIRISGTMGFGRLRVRHARR